MAKTASGQAEPRKIAPGLAVIFLGLVFMAVGLAFWLGWAVAMVIEGALLTTIGLLSAVAARGSSGGEE